MNYENTTTQDHIPLRYPTKEKDKKKMFKKYLNEN